MVEVELDDGRAPAAAPGVTRARRRVSRALAAGVVLGALTIAAIDAARAGADRAEDVGGPGRTVARDAVTGAARWVTSRSLTPGTLAPECRSIGGAQAAVACELPGRPGIQAANTDEALGATPGSLVVLDAATGAVLDVTVLEVGTVGWDVVGTELVVGRLDDGDLVLDRIDPAAGRSRWTARVAMPASDGGEVLARQLALRVADGLVLVEGAAAVVVDAGTGTPRD